MNFAHSCTNKLQKSSLQSLQTVLKMSTLIIYVCQRSLFVTINAFVNIFGR